MGTMGIYMGVPWCPGGLRIVTGVVTAVAQVPSLARELLHAMGTAKKKKEKEKKMGLYTYIALWALRMEGI